MEIYKGSLIWEFPIDWSDPVNRSYDFNLNEIKIGFGERKFAPTQNSVRKKFDISLKFFDKCEIEKMESFLDQVKNNLKGFWFPSEREEMTLKSSISNSSFDIEYNDFSSNYNTRPDIHLWFHNQEKTIKEADKITSIAYIDSSTERVTIENGLNHIPAIFDDNIKTTLIGRLFFVRVDSSSVSWKYYTDGCAQLNLTLIELTEEYDTAEVGLDPIFLYKFEANGTIWHLTSYEENILAGGNTYLTSPISHNSINKEILLGQDDLLIESFLAPGSVWELFLPTAISVPIEVFITETTLSQKLETPIVFSGFLEQVTFQGLVVSAKSRNKTFYTGARIPRFVIQQQCNYNLFDVNCGKSASAYQKTTTLASIITTNTIRVTDPSNLNGLASKYFTGGYITINSGINIEKRAISVDTKISETEHELVLRTPLFRAVVSDTVTVFPGCDKRSDTCDNKFSNIYRFSGIKIARKNFTLNAVKVKRSSGGKK